MCSSKDRQRQSVLVKKLYDAGYLFSLDSKAFNKKGLIENPPIHDELFFIDIPKSEHRLIKIIVEEFIDEPLMAPNGFHVLSGSMRILYGQENIDRQIKEIIGNEMPCGLIWYFNVKRSCSTIKGSDKCIN